MSLKRTLKTLSIDKKYKLIKAKSERQKQSGLKSKLNKAKSKGNKREIEL
mgnify:CR=1 FL=1